jgi:hypothetical protein
MNDVDEFWAERRFYLKRRKRVKLFCFSSANRDPATPSAFVPQSRDFGETRGFRLRSRLRRDESAWQVTLITQMDIAFVPACR